MLDNTENQRLHERIVKVAPFLPGLAAAPAPAHDDCDGATEEAPFSNSKTDRILERVYDRIAEEASESIDPRLGQLIVEALAHMERTLAFPEGKVERILARVQARLDADQAAPAPAEAVKRLDRNVSALAGMHSVACALLLRHLSFEARLFSDPRGPRPLTDGPAD
jgi:hypothetical protein